jgi:hypothetical protein
MSPRACIAVLIGPIIQAVLFGIGTTIVLSVPALAADAAFHLPLVVVLSLNLTPAIAWTLAPRLQARTWRREPPLIRSLRRVPVPLVRPVHRRSFRTASFPNPT